MPGVYFFMFLSHMTIKDGETLWEVNLKNSDAPILKSSHSEQPADKYAIEKKTKTITGTKWGEQKGLKVF